MASLDMTDDGDEIPRKVKKKWRRKKKQAAETIDAPEYASKKKKKPHPSDGFDNDENHGKDRSDVDEGVIVGEEDVGKSKQKEKPKVRDIPQPESNRRDEDDISDVGEDDPVDNYDNHYDRHHYNNDGDCVEEDEEPRFKYSTADLADGGCRNSTCCLVSIGIFFIIVAIVVSILMKKYIPDRRRMLWIGYRGKPFLASPGNGDRWNVFDGISIDSENGNFYSLRAQQYKHK